MPAWRQDKRHPPAVPPPLAQNRASLVRGFADWRVHVPDTIMGPGARRTNDPADDRMSEPAEDLNEPMSSDSSSKPAAPAPARAPRFPRLWSALAATPLLLAFLLASFPARNSEVWRHLATGRALLAGTYWFGVDPFAYTTEGAFWVNHSWLYDLLLYLLHLACGEYVVVVNALLAAGIASFMLLASGWPKHLWTSSLAVALALVCLGPHLTLTPVMCSYLLLAFTLWWLDRKGKAALSDWSLRGHLPLLAAFALWANCDEWFLLGPITATLFWLGRTLRRGDDACRPRAQQLVALIAASLAVCLVNPHHVWVFRLPGALGTSPAADDVKSGLEQLLSLSWPQVPVPVVAYLLLALLGLLTFLARRSPKSWPQLLVWLALFALSLYRTTAVPFFAIVAGQVLAQNWQALRAPSGGDGLLSSENMTPSRRRFDWLEPLAAMVALLALLALACPGWLQGSFEKRGWNLRPDPSMKHLAEQLAAWHAQGELSEQTRGFNLSTDVAHYIEWHCPQETVFLDGRAHLFPQEVVADFQQLSNALAKQTLTGKVSEWSEVHAVLNQWHCSHFIAADPVDRRLAAALRSLWQDSAEWSLVELEGRGTVFVWRNPGHGQSLQLPAVDLHGRAFDPALARTAPAEGMGREPQPPAWQQCWDWSDAEGVLDRDEAILNVVHFESSRTAYFERNRLILAAEPIAALLGTVGPHHGGIPAAAGPKSLDLIAERLQPLVMGGEIDLNDFLLQTINQRMQNSDQGPSGSLLLAVRAARRALHENPDDALAHLRLGRAYQLLQQQTIERAQKDSFPLLDQLRKVQALVALKRAVHLRPDLSSAHELLANICMDARGYDLALPHVQAQLRLSRAAGPQPHETAEDFTARIDRLAEYEQQLGKQVRELLNLVDTKSFELDVYSKARLAESNGLPGYALEQLLKSNYAEFGREGAIFQLYLLLHAGRTADFRMMIDPEQEPVLGTFNFHWLQILLAAADGDYARADEHLRRLIAAAPPPVESPREPAWARLALAPVDGLQIVSGSSNNPLRLALAFTPRGLEGQLLPGPARSPRGTRQDADHHALRGLLALEQGDIESAQRSFQQGLAIWNGSTGSAPIARNYLRLMVKAKPER